MKTTTEDLCIYFLCFMLGYLFCQNMMETEGWGQLGGDRHGGLFGGTEGLSTKEGKEKEVPGWAWWWMALE